MIQDFLLQEIRCVFLLIICVQFKNCCNSHYDVSEILVPSNC